MTGTAMIQTMVSVKSSTAELGGKLKNPSDQSSGNFKDLLSAAGDQGSDSPGRPRSDAVNQKEEPDRREPEDEVDDKTSVKDDKKKDDSAVLQETAPISQSGVPGAEAVVQPEAVYNEALQDLSLTAGDESSIQDLASQAGAQHGTEILPDGGFKYADQMLPTAPETQMKAQNMADVFQDVKASDDSTAMLQIKDSLMSQYVNVKDITAKAQTGGQQEALQTGAAPQTGLASQTDGSQALDLQTKGSVVLQQTQTGVNSTAQEAGGQPKAQTSETSTSGQTEQPGDLAQPQAMKTASEEGTQGQHAGQEDGSQKDTYSRPASDLKLDQLTKSIKQTETQDTTVLQAASEGGQTAQVETVQIKVAEPYEQGIRNLPKSLANQIETHIAAGKREFIVQLAPEQLGRIAIHITTSDTGVKVLLSCENQKTMELLTQKASQIGQIVEHNTGSPAVVEVKEDNYWSQQKNPTDEHRNQNQDGGQDQRRQDQEHGREESDDFIHQLRLGLYKQKMVV